LPSTEIGFSSKAEFADFLRFEEAYDDIDTLLSPTRYLVVEPVAGARATHDRQPPRNR
jgi:hypothetical protein